MVEEVWRSVKGRGAEPHFGLAAVISKFWNETDPATTFNTCHLADESGENMVMG